MSIATNFEIMQKNQVRLIDATIKKCIKIRDPKLVAK
jgi:hypothetical protein